MKKFCFVCGKEDSKLKDGMCSECYDKRVKLIEVPKSINVSVCSKCGYYLFKGDWKDTGIKNVILNDVKLLQKGADVSIKDIGNNNYEISAHKKKDEKHIVRIVLKKMICPICARKLCDYFEAVLQIRGNYDDKKLDFIEDTLFRINKKDRRAFYTYEEVDGGIDIKLGNKKAAAQVAELCKKKFDCSIKKAYQLNTMKDGQNVYRNYICVRFN
ncbi:MAG: NMD3-related protein [Candidatus Aenigmarchaeota archaeon]|nr:NMD3-related protein [Candidatus Aenigmarchaeota archaeon]